MNAKNAKGAEDTEGQREVLRMGSNSGAFGLRFLRPLRPALLIPTSLGALCVLSALWVPVAKAAGPTADVSPRRLEALSRPYLGKPYRLDCLGEAGGIDNGPLFTRACADCQTLVEQVMAEAIGPAVGGLEPAVRLVRYRSSKVAFQNRYHYCIPDWLQNPWPARDVTAQLGGDTVKTVTRTINLPQFLAGKKVDPRLSPVSRPAKVAVRYIPRNRVNGLTASAMDGKIALWVLNKPGIVVGHCGFTFNQAGKAIFRHASQTQKRVIDEPLSAYLARAPRTFIGLMVLQPDATRLQ